MRPKTLGSTGGGPAHMKAVYPEAWRGRIVRIVAKYADEAPKPERIPQKRSTTARGVVFGAWVREALTGQPQRLTWDVDLIEDVGTPDAVGDPDGYADRRWTMAIARLQEALEGLADEKHAVTELVVIVSCLGKVDATEFTPHRIDLPMEQRIDVAVAQKPPPFGRWRLMTDSEVEQKAGTVGLPSTYFIDGMPF